MATERHRPERRAARILPGAAGGVARRLFLLGVLVFLGWCGLALLSGTTASAAEPGGSAAPGSSSLLGTGTLSDVLDQATSAVRSAGNHPFDLVSIEPSDRRPAANDGTDATARAGRTHGDEATRGVARSGDRAGGVDRSVLGLVPVPVRGLADPSAGVPAPLGTAVSALDHTLGHVADTPLGAVTHGLVTPIDDTVARAATGLGAVRGAVPTGRVAVPVAFPATGRSAVRGTPADVPTRHASAVRTPANASGTGDGPRAGLPGDGDDHTPSAPAAGDAPAMPLGVAGGSASAGSGGGNAGASGTYLDFAGVRPSAASGPVWTVRHTDEQVPLDDQDRPRVSPD